eukprot:ANDGO_00690.mRNA.1 Malonyl CoA-acyl carrier protein transacylase
MSIKVALKEAFASSLGESPNWSDIEYAREFKGASARPQYQRAVRFGNHSLQCGRDLLASFADDGNMGIAVVVVPVAPSTCPFAGIGIDVVRSSADHHSGSSQLDHDNAVWKHCLAECLYKATYYGGGQQPHFMANVYDHVRIARSLSATSAVLDVSGSSADAMKCLVEREGGNGCAAAASWCSSDNADATTFVIGWVLIAKDSSLFQAASEPKPALAQLIDEHKVNFIYALPGQASEFVPVLRRLHKSSPAARRFIDTQMRRLLELHNLDASFVLTDDGLMQNDGDALIRAEFSQPLIGLTQAAINVHLAAMGYDLSKAVVLGHSQGQMLVLHAVGAVEDDDVLDLLVRNGRYMQEVDSWWDPESGDDLTLSQIAKARSDEQFDLVERFTGKMSMASIVGLSVPEVTNVLLEVRRLLDAEEVIEIGLINVEASSVYQETLTPPGWIGNADIPSVVVVSGTCEGIKQFFRCVKQLGRSDIRVRVLPTTVAFHSTVVEPALRQIWGHVEGKSMKRLRMPAICNSNGVDMRSLQGRPAILKDGKLLDPVLAVVVEEQCVNRVDWPIAVWSALRALGPSFLEKPIVVLNGGPGTAVGKFIEAITTDGLNRCLVNMIHFDSTEGTSLLHETDRGIIEEFLQRRHPQKILGIGCRPICDQVKHGEPRIHGEYSGPISYLSSVILQDDEQRREFINRVEKVLNLHDGDGETPSLWSEFLHHLGFDGRLPIAVAAMTGNNRAELVSSVAARGYLCFLAATTLGSDLEALTAEIREIHRRTQELLHSRGDPLWSEGRPFGANVIHGDPSGFYKLQVERILQAKVQEGIPIKIVSVAFSMITLADWKETYEPLLRAGIAILPLCENERRWEHFCNVIYPEVDRSLHHLLAFAPEGAEGGGHNIDRQNPSIRYGHSLAASLLDSAPPPYPWFMTGGQSTPSAIADALLVMANQPVRGGVQLGSLMQVALESAPPVQVKEFLAKAAFEGADAFVQCKSEFDRSINLIRNSFSEDLLELTVMLESKGSDEPIGAELGARTSTLFLREPVSQRKLLHRLWCASLTERNESRNKPLLTDVWPYWLSSDQEKLAAALSRLSRKQVISLFRSYRTWAIMEPDIDPQRSYVLGGRSIRSGMLALAAEGVDPFKYLLKPAHEILEDLRDRALEFLQKSYRLAMEIELSKNALQRRDPVLAAKRLQGVRVLHSDAHEWSCEIVAVPEADDWIRFLSSFGGRKTFNLADGIAEERVSASEFGVRKVSNPLRSAVRTFVGDVVCLRISDGTLREISVSSKEKRELIKITFDEHRSVFLEQWNLMDSTGRLFPVTWSYTVRRSIVGRTRVDVTNYSSTIDDLRSAYLGCWGCNMADGTTERVVADDVLRFHKSMGATSKRFVVRRLKSALVHPFFALHLAWKSLVQCALTSPFAIDFSRVVHSGQSFQSTGVALAEGDVVRVLSQVIRAQDLRAGREVQIWTVVVREPAGELVATLSSKFLSRCWDPSQFSSSQVLFEHLPPAQHSLEQCMCTEGSDALDVHVFSKEFSVSRSMMESYYLDRQWLHTDDRFANRCGLADGVIVQGWLLLLHVGHLFLEGFVGLEHIDRFVGFGESTAVVSPVAPGEQLLLDVRFSRLLQNNIECFSFVVVSRLDGKRKVQGTLLLRAFSSIAMFVGNASQRVGMASSLCETSPHAKARITSALNEIDSRLCKIVCDKESSRRTDEEYLNEVENSSCAIVATCVAYFENAQERGAPPPAYVVGHSLGQYTAAVISGALSLTDSLRIVRKRGLLLKEHCRGRIASVVKRSLMDLGVVLDTLQEVVASSPAFAHSVLEIANINCLSHDYSQVVISGDEDALHAAVKRFGALDYIVKVLPGNVAFHSSKLVAMEALLRDFIVSSTSISNPKIPMLSIVKPCYEDGSLRVLRTKEDVLEELVGMNSASVQWDGVMKTARRSGVLRFVEFGESSVLNNLARRIFSQDPEVRHASVSIGLEALIKTLISASADAVHPSEVPVVSEMKSIATVAANLVAPLAPALAPAPAPAPATATAAVPARSQAGSRQSLAVISPLQWCAIDLALSTCRIDAKGSAMLSPLLSDLSVIGSPSALVWAAIVTSLVDTNESIKLKDIVSSKRLANLNLSSLEITGLINQIRHRLNIAVPPSDHDAKELEGGTVDGIFSLMCRLWDHAFSSAPAKDGEQPWKDVSCSYKSLMNDHQVSGRTFFDLAKDGKVTVESEVFQTLYEQVCCRLVDPLSSTENLDYLMKRVENWKPQAEFKRESDNLRKVRTALFDRLRKQLTVHCARQEDAPLGISEDGVSAVPVSAVNVDALKKLVDDAIRERIAAGASSIPSKPLTQDSVILDMSTGCIIRNDAATADAHHAKKLLEKLSHELSASFISAMTHSWSARVHAAWSHSNLNSCCANALRLMEEVSSKNVEFDSDAYRYKVCHVSHQMDQTRCAWLSSLREFFVSRQDVARSRVCCDLLQHFENGCAVYLHWWEPFTIQSQSDGSRVSRPRAMPLPMVLSQWSDSNFVDSDTMSDVSKLVAGGMDLKGKRVLMLGGLGTIGKPTACVLLSLGADVWITTRSTFGDVEDTLREMRDEWAVCGASLHASTAFSPNYSNIDLLVGALQQLDWKPDIIMNAMASEDYGTISQRLDFFSVMYSLVEAFRYAVGKLLQWYREGEDEHSQPVLTVVNFSSPNDKFALGGSGSYPFAKASMPPGQWAMRRDSEGLYYTRDGSSRPMLREISLITGAVVPRVAAVSSSKAAKPTGIMSSFQHISDLLESVALEEFDTPLWVFDGADMAAIVVSLLNPSYGDQDVIGRCADGGFMRLDQVVVGGIQHVLNRTHAMAALEMHDAEDNENAADNPEVQKQRHVFEVGQVRSLVDYGFWIDELDGADAPYPMIDDEDIVVVGMGMVSSWGDSAISSFANVMDLQQSHFLRSEEDWPSFLGVLYVARAMGLAVEDGMTLDDVVHKFGKQIRANLGPRMLVRTGQRSDEYRRYHDYVGDDEILLGFRTELSSKLEKTSSSFDVSVFHHVERLLQSGYQLEERSVLGEKVVFARKEGASLSRMIIDAIGPQIVADIPPLDWSRLGGNLSIADHDARNILMGQLALTEACRMMGLVPREVTERHGAQNVCVLFSNGMGALETIRRQQQDCMRGMDVGQLGIVLSIPSAAAGRTASDQFGATGPATDDPQACATAKKTLWTAVQQMRSALRKAEDLEKRIGRYNSESMRLEVDRLRATALQKVMCVSCSDDGGTHECQNAFDRVGALLKASEADAKEFPPHRQCRPHDRDRVAKFQIGVGAGAMMLVTGWAVKRYGYRPVAVIRASECCSDGPTLEPDGKSRAWTGVGRFGQRKVFVDGLRDARLFGDVTLKDIYMMSSHSTGTGGDSIQSESFAIGAFLEALDWCMLQSCAGAENETVQQWVAQRTNRTVEDLRSSVASSNDILERSSRLAEQLNFSTSHTAQWISEIANLEAGMKRVLQIDNVRIFESHPKYNLRHCLGGTLTEDVLLLMSGMHRRTLPHPGLNNLEVSTASSPFSATLTKSTHVGATQPSRLRAGTLLQTGDRLRYCVAGNSFGFNGLDGFAIYEIPQALRFSSVDQARVWMLKAIQSEARSVALHRGTQSGKISALQYVQSDSCTTEDYEDLKEFDAAAFVQGMLEARGQQQACIPPWMTQ